jgi:hypothetical protein
MIVYDLFVHKKSVSKRKVCIIFIKNLKIKKNEKNPKKNIFSGFFFVFFFIFFVWVFKCQPWFAEGAIRDGKGGRGERARPRGKNPLVIKNNVPGTFPKRGL